MERIASQIMKKAGKLAEGSLITAKTLLNLGSRAGVDQALSRLTRRGELLRVSRGVYVLPVAGRFGKRPPSQEKVVEALATQQREAVTPSAATAANALGLTTQVPVRQIYLTSGRSRNLTLGKLNIELRHAPKWQLGQGHGGEIVRALFWAGRERAKETVEILSSKIPPSEFAHIIQSSSNLPSWMIDSMNRQAQHAA
jgi:Family of unknown function (DUF6088)